jgi:hypothetical protein
MRSGPITQGQIEEELMRLLGILESETEEFEVLAQHSAETEASHKGQWAKQYLSSTGSVRSREAEADYAMSDSMYSYKIAEALMKAKREKLLSLRTSIDALRTLNANVRAQVG